jgi:hypothetical protein
MKNPVRLISAAAMAAAFGLSAAAAFAQANPDPAPAAASSKSPWTKPAKPGDRHAAGYVAPHLANGQPDLQGIWSNASNTTMTRPAKFKSLVMTDAENAAAQAANPANIRQATDDNQKESDGLLTGKDLASGRGYNAFWIDPGKAYANIKGEWHTSWIVDPPSGQVPFSEDGRKLMASMRKPRGTGYDNPEERALGERCIIGFGGTGGPPMMNVLYNNNYRISQSPDYVVITVEMDHDARIIPLKGRHKPSEIKPYLGDSVGWWDGDTLVVETINQNPNGGSQVQLTPSGKIIERFTRYDNDQILYEFEVVDPALYTQTWKGEIALNRTKGEMYEYACHEGNYGLHGILEGGRNNDRMGKSNARNNDRGDEG